LTRSASACVSSPFDEFFLIFEISLKLLAAFWTDQTGSAELKSQCELMPVKTTPKPAPTAIETPVVAACSGFSAIQSEVFCTVLEIAESIVRVQLAPKLNALETLW
jgi:hypothetical protein